VEQVIPQLSIRFGFPQQMVWRLVRTGEVVDTVVAVVHEADHEHLCFNLAVRAEESGTVCLCGMGIKQSTRDQYPDDRAVGAPLARSVDGKEVAVSEVLVR